MSKEKKSFDRLPFCGYVVIRWRREWDLNPRYAHAYDGFRNRCLQPLDHLFVMDEKYDNGDTTVFFDFTVVS